MIRYTGTMSTKGEARFLLDDADDVKSLPLGEFTWGGKTYPKPAVGSVAFVEETFQRFTFDGTAWEEAGGVSSWNDLKDKPFETEEQKTQCYGNTLTSSNSTLANGNYCYTLGANDIHCSEVYDGQTILVVFDGVEYQCQRVGDYGADSYSCSYAVGNTSLLSGVSLGDGYGSLPIVDTGEPFVIWGQSYYSNYCFIVCKEDGEHAVEVYEFASNVVKIDEKYLHGPYFATAAGGSMPYIKAYTTAGNAELKEGIVAFVYIKNDSTCSDEITMYLDESEEKSVYQYSGTAITGVDFITKGTHCFVYNGDSWYFVV